MSENKGELTFQMIWELLKKSFVRIVIYAAIAAVLAGSIGLIVHFTTKPDTQYQAIVQYNYKGAEEGLDPWGRKLDVSKIKSDKVVMSALEKLNYSTADAAKIKLGIVNNITLSGMVPEEAMEQILIIKEIATKNPTALNDLTSVSYVSTSYVISLTNDEKLNLSGSECIAILNAIVEVYISDFRKTYGYSDLLGTFIAENIAFDDYDYIQIYDLFDSQLTEIVRFLSSRMIDAGSFRHTDTKMSFEDMRVKTQNLKNYELKTLETYIMENGVQKEDINVPALTYIEERLRDITDQTTIVNTRKQSTLDEMDSFKFQYNTYTDVNGNVNSILANGEAYSALSANLASYNAQLAELSTTEAKWVRWENKFKNLAAISEEERKEITVHTDKMISDLNAKVVSLMTDINSAIDEYMEVEVLKNSVLPALAATATTPEGSGLKILLIVEVLVIIVAALVAIGITKRKESRSTVEAAPAVDAAIVEEAIEEDAE